MFTAAHSVKKTKSGCTSGLYIMTMHLPTSIFVTKLLAQNQIPASKHLPIHQILPQAIFHFPKTRNFIEIISFWIYWSNVMVVLKGFWTMFPDNVETVNMYIQLEEKYSEGDHIH